MDIFSDEHNRKIAPTRFIVAVLGIALFIFLAIQPPEPFSDPPLMLRIVLAGCAVFMLMVAVWLGVKYRRGSPANPGAEGMVSELREKAVSLSEVLHEMADRLDRYRGDSRTSEFAARFARSLRPAIANYDRAVLQERSRSAAAEAVSDLGPIVRGISAAGGRGEMDFRLGDTMARYYDLHTIFREARLRDQHI